MPDSFLKALITGHEDKITDMTQLNKTYAVNVVYYYIILSFFKDKMS